MPRKLSLLSVLFFAAVSFAADSSLFLGLWDAKVTPPSKNGSSYEVPFELAVEQNGTKLSGTILNGSDPISFSRVLLGGDALMLFLDQYDGKLIVKCAEKACEHLEGEYVRNTHSGETHFKFTARRHSLQVASERISWSWPSLAGQWAFDTGEKGADRFAPGTFELSDLRKAADGGAEATVTGTIAPVSGDFGLLSGTMKVRNAGDKLPAFQLSRFDGIHTLLVTGEFISEDKIKGQIAYNAASVHPFTAERSTDRHANTEPDPEHVTSVKNPDEKLTFLGMDLSAGVVVTQNDPRFRGKPIIIDIFGTWCPNCHDEAPLLKEIYDRYHAQGLEIVGLAFQYDSDKARNTRLIDVFRKKYAIQYPLLYAGTTDEGVISKVFPQLVDFGAYPTTIFLDRSGKVHAIHAGFAGPATGQYDEVKSRFETLVKEILR